MISAIRVVEGNSQFERCGGVVRWRGMSARSDLCARDTERIMVSLVGQCSFLVVRCLSIGCIIQRVCGRFCIRRRMFIRKGLKARQPGLVVAVIGCAAATKGGSEGECNGVRRSERKYCTTQYSTGIAANSVGGTDTRLLGKLLGVI